MITLSIDDQKTSTDLMQFMLKKIDPSGTHMTASSMKEAMEILSDDVQIVFLDIEMPGMNGIEATEKIRSLYKRINVIYVTGHPEYSFDAHQTHPSGFLRKPICERDIIRELQDLRFPIEQIKLPLMVQCSPFSVLVNNAPFDFKRDRTIELFAYLLYREGAFCTNGEILGALWDGAPDKQGYLRQLILDLREGLKEAGAEYIIMKKYGKIAIDINAIYYQGQLSEINEDFHWF